MTGIVITSIICGTFLALCVMGMISNHLQRKSAKNTLNELTDKFRK